MLEEQLAIFLYACVTGLSVRHLGERFQRSNDTISKYVIPQRWLVLNLLIFEGISNVFSTHFPPPRFIHYMSGYPTQTVQHLSKSFKAPNTTHTSPMPSAL
jgi:hypothetical protein